jgi:hypothetical protein
MAGGGDAGAVAIYGIKACDTMRKARAWLDGHGVGSIAACSRDGRRRLGGRCY